MKLSPQAKKIHSQINTASPKMGDLKKLAKEIKKNQELAMELWSTGDYFLRLLAILIMDKKLLSQDFLDKLDQDMQIHSFDEKNRMMEWLMANQLMKDKKVIALIQSWENSSSNLQRRTYWYYQARLRWTGQTPPENTPKLLTQIEKNISAEAPEVQWAMNFTAGWIGVFDESYRTRCIKLGKKTGLYKDEVVAKNCTPSYLPAFIDMEVAKREKN
ncbi:MAG: DNA alkylation repair protein [Spirochaetota bacterium]